MTILFIVHVLKKILISFVEFFFHASIVVVVVVVVVVVLPAVIAVIVAAVIDIDVAIWRQRSHDAPTPANFTCMMRRRR